MRIHIYTVYIYMCVCVYVYVYICICRWNIARFFIYVPMEFIPPSTRHCLCQRSREGIPPAPRPSRSCLCKRSTCQDRPRIPSRRHRGPVPPKRGRFFGTFTMKKRGTNWTNHKHVGFCTIKTCVPSTKTGGVTSRDFTRKNGRFHQHFRGSMRIQLYGYILVKSLTYHWAHKRLVILASILGWFWFDRCPKILTFENGVDMGFQWISCPKIKEEHDHHRTTQLDLQGLTTPLTAKCTELGDPAASGTAETPQSPGRKLPVGGSTGQPRRTKHLPGRWRPIG